MSKKLAIKGHPTRGNEVIKLLEMMGGCSPIETYKLYKNRCYLINDKGWIVWDYIGSEEINEYVIFTLEEFLEKYPFKVGDKVEVCETGKVFTIGNMIWDDELYTIHYCNMEDIEYYIAKELKLYKETNMNENKCTHCVYAVNNNHCGLRGFRSNFNVNYCSAQNVDKLPNGFELQEDGYFSWVNKKPKYPKTYGECCEKLGIEEDLWFVYEDIDGNHINSACISNYRIRGLELYHNLEKLKICRDAYWKIAGEEMGLDKPWEPDWKSEVGNEVIVTVKGEIVLDTQFGINAILVFPTEEMRDAFYENFKELIESCKELL